jgi:hypothetical protein
LIKYAGITFFRYLLFLAGMLLFSPADAQTGPGRYLKEVLPCPGCLIHSLYPVIQWPVKKGKNITYDVELVRDTFHISTPFMAKKALPYCIFIPYKPLDKGVWFWRYKVNGFHWSPYFSFQITTDYAQHIPPDVSLFTAKIPRTHPRVLTDQSFNVTTISVDNEDRLAILSEANRLLNLPDPVDTIDLSDTTFLTESQKNRLEKDAAYRIGHQVYQRIYLLCQAYLLTNDAKYFQVAKTLGIIVTGWDREGYSGMVDFSDAKCMLGMALVFDTFYDKLSENEKKLLLEAIHIRATYFYQWYKNDIETKILSGHFWQHILHYLFQTSLILFDHVDEANHWLSYCYEIFFAKSPILSGESGGWIEGLSYFTMNMETLIDIPLFVRNYTGFDFFKVHPFYKNMANWLIYHVPAGAVGDGFADNATHIYAPGAKYQAFAWEMAKLTREPLFVWYAEKCGALEPIHLSNEPTLRWTRLAKTNTLPLPANRGNHIFPFARLFVDGGAGSMQSHPGNPEKNLALFMRASPIGAYGHILAEQNTFNISYRGKRIFFKTGYKLGMDDPHRTGWSQLTKSANGILINGNGQVISSEAAASFKRLIQGSTLAYVKSDASSAYKSNETKENAGLRKFIRHYLLLPPHTIIVFDELESENPANWQWLLHSENDIQINRVDNQLQSADSCLIQLITSYPMSFSKKDSFDVPLVNFRFMDEEGEGFASFDTDQKHITFQTDKPTGFQRIISIFSFGNEEIRENGKGKATEAIRNFQWGDWELNLETDTSKEPLFELTNKQLGTYFNMFGNTTAWSTQWNANPHKGESLLIEKDDKNVFIRKTNGDFK